MHVQVEHLLSAAPAVVDDDLEPIRGPLLAGKPRRKTPEPKPGPPRPRSQLALFDDET